MSQGKKIDSGASWGARRATGAEQESQFLIGLGRWSAKRKISVVLELLRYHQLEQRPATCGNQNTGGYGGDLSSALAQIRRENRLTVDS